MIKIIDIMIFKRFQFREKKPELCYICEQEILKSNFFSENKNFRNAVLEYVPTLLISFLLHSNLIYKVWVGLTNERQHKTQGFLGKIRQSHGTNLSRGQWVLPETYKYLNPTELFDLCCSVVQYTPSNITRQTIFGLSLSFKEKKTL